MFLHNRQQQTAWQLALSYRRLPVRVILMGAGGGADQMYAKP
jgi:hypothetical protein